MVDYVVASMEDVMKGKLAKYNSSLKAVKEATRSKAGKKMGTLSFGGITPEGDQYAEVNPRPGFFNDVNGDQLSPTFRQNFTSTGFQTILSADLSADGNVGKSWVMGVAGVCIADPVKRITQLYMENGDYTHPILNIENIKTEEGGVAIVFNITESNVDKFVFDETGIFKLNADVESTGYQTVIPLGVAELTKDKAIDTSF